MKKNDNYANDVARVALADALQKVLGEDALRVASNKVALAFRNELGNEFFYVVSVSVPKGSRDGEAYDGRAEADNYAFKLSEKAKQKAKREQKTKVKE